MFTFHAWTSAPTVAPSGLGGGGGDRHELIISWTVSRHIIFMTLCPHVSSFSIKI